MQKNMQKIGSYIVRRYGDTLGIALQKAFEQAGIEKGDMVSVFSEKSTVLIKLHKGRGSDA
jgi:hypothetical protein